MLKLFRLLILFAVCLASNNLYSQCSPNESYFEARIVPAQTAPLGEFIIQLRYNSTGLPDFGSDPSGSSSTCNSFIPDGTTVNAGTVFAIAWDSTYTYLPGNCIDPSLTPANDNSTGVELNPNPFHFVTNSPTPMHYNGKFAQDYADGAAQVLNLGTWTDGVWYNIGRITTQSGSLPANVQPYVISADDPGIISGIFAQGCPYIAQAPINLSSFCEVGFKGDSSNSQAPYPNISGVLYRDDNQNCNLDVNDIKLKNITVGLYQNNILLQSTTTSINGRYFFFTPSFGTYNVVVDTANTGLNAACSSGLSFTSTITAIDSIDTHVDFPLICASTSTSNNDIKVQYVHSFGAFTPNQLSQVYGFINTDNICVATQTCTIKMTSTGPVHFYQALPIGGVVPAVYNDSVVWQAVPLDSISFLSVYNYFTGVYAQVMTDTGAILGQNICFTLEAMPSLTDVNPTNNSYNYCTQALTSFDPNDKQVLPNGNVLPTNEYLTYTIRFQNTGTAMAYNIKILDTISNDVDFSSLEVIGTSHPFTLLTNVSSRVVQFNFAAINLPDSNSNEPASHGFIAYRIKQHPNLAFGTIINNTADIYFDYNAPVRTNTTQTEINYPQQINSSSIIPDFVVYPQPAKTKITIRSNNFDFHTICIKSIDGRTIQCQHFSSRKEQELNLKPLAKGTYLIEVKGKETTQLKKITIE